MSRDDPPDAASTSLDSRFRGNDGEGGGNDGARSGPEAAKPPDAAPASPFQPLPDELDFPSMERRILDFWAEQGTFDQLRAKNADGPRWSFIDGPITANNPMGVHHAWGRTYKDLYQRYRAMRGYHQRYQNGFDCQGLWLEVEVEKELGFKSKRDIEAFGLEAFAEACRERVATYSAVQTSQSARLGQWMDWDNSYYTHSDSNIEHIWSFLRRCHERGWIEVAQRAMPWCARCGTALSQHELIDTYQEITHDALYVRLPLHGHDNAWLLVWTTTPWTLAANVAAAVEPELTYAEVEVDGERYFLAEATVPEALGDDAQVVGHVKGADMLGWTYDGPFDELPAVAGTAHRVIPWKDVGADEGTGIVHIAPGAGEDDFRLSQELGLPVLVPIDENGVYVDGYDWLTGRDARQVADDVIADLRARGLLYRAHRFEHRYPHCWRCQEELVFRVDDEWFIRADEVRQPMLDAAAAVHWVPEYAGARMADWLRNMGDWNISRRRYWGLPLPFYPCQACGHLTVIGSKAHLEERAISGLDQLRELHRPWIDRVVIRCEACEAPVHRIDAVGDAWLDAGIVPFSTLGYLEQSDEFQRWYPADFITEMREQIRLWFYSMLFMSVTLEDRSPYRAVFVYEKLNDETGRAMHKSWGNAIEFGEAAERMGADVMRWLYAGQNPLYNINFGYGPAGEVKRRMLTLWNVYAFFVTYARLDEFDPSQPPVPLAERADLDRWVLSRLQSLVDTMTETLDSFHVHRGVRAAQAFIEDVSNWYVRRGRRRYWKSEDDVDKRAAYQTLYEVLTTLVRVLAPVMPFWMEDIYQTLVRAVDPSAPASVHLTDWPQPRDDRRDLRLDAAMAEVQRVVRAGRAARNAASVKLRQPLRTALVQVPDDAAWDAVESLKPHVLDELNVKTLERMTSEHELVDYQVQPNYRRLGPRFGPRVKQVAAVLAALDASEAVRELDERGQLTVDLSGKLTGGAGSLRGSLSVTPPSAAAPDSDDPVALDVDDEVVLAPDDLNVRRTPREGFGVAEQDGVIVAVTTDIDDELAREGLARELVHATQGLRRDAGLEVSDRIRLWIDGGDVVDQTLAEHQTWIAGEVLALAVNDGESQPDAAQAAPTLNGVPVQIRLSRAPRSD